MLKLPQKPSDLARVTSSSPLPTLATGAASGRFARLGAPDGFREVFRAKTNYLKRVDLSAEAVIELATKDQNNSSFRTRGNLEGNATENATKATRFPARAEDDEVDVLLSG